MMSRVRITPRQKLAPRLAPHAAPARPHHAATADRLDAMFPPAAAIVTAPSRRERAGLVLRLSDELIISQFDALKEACEQTGFAEGAGYLAQRFVSLHAPRLPDGRLLEAEADLVEIWRRGVAAIAGWPL